MAKAKNILGKLKSSDGRIRVKTLSGVSALVAAIALLVGVLPVMANHADPKSKVEPDPLNYGGGSGACAFVESAAAFEAHDNNPATKTLTGPDETEIEITVSSNGRTFSFEIDPTSGMAVYDVVVNGGPQNLHYNYDGKLGVPVTSDVGLHAPMRTNTQPHNLSHINICYDQATVFECGEELERKQEGLFTVGTVTIFGNSVWECEDKLGAFVVDNDPEGPNVLIDFGTGEGTVAGIATFTKDFGQPPAFESLKYQLTEDDPLVEVEWCAVRPKDSTETGTDGNEFNDWLGANYPSLEGVKDAHTGAIGDAIACKVHEEETADGIQFTVVYFEFEDPQFR
jgi:hypothetical protein